MRRITSSIRINDNLVLRPASTDYVLGLIEAFEETWPEVSYAMPWIVTEKPFESQIYSFIEDTERKGRKGLLHHWIIIRPWDDTVLGLIGLIELLDQVRLFGILDIGFVVLSNSTVSHDYVLMLY